MRLFFDNHFSPEKVRFIDYLVKEYGHRAIHYRDWVGHLLAAEVTDAGWISGLAREGNWIVVSCDKKMLRRQIETSAIKGSGLTFIFFPASHAKLRLMQRAINTIKALPKLIEYAEAHRAGYCLELNANYKLPR